MLPKPEDILDFWQREIGPERWFDPAPAFDDMVRAQFSEIQAKAARDELKSWEKNPEGAMCLILLLQELPRRMFRGTAKAFDSDDQALTLAHDSLVKYFDDRIDKSYKLVFYLPYLRSESLANQKLALFYIRERTKEEAWLALSETATGIIDRFNRFPQRNAALGRTTTEAESDYLAKAPAIIT